jgi:ribosomal protein S18 acetylase RimI-like enzyme
VVDYRSFRNTDPPALAAVWNEALAGRGAVRLRGSLPLENCVFAKLYFDPAGLVLAEEAGAVVGFGHAGFGANPDGSAQSFAAGVTCMLAVRPAFRRRGIGTELLRRCEEYLRGRGATTLHAGPRRPLDPFYLGLYGGSDLPGVLDSDAETAAFLKKRGYASGPSSLVFQRRLGQALKLLDPRSTNLRRRYDLQVDLAPARSLTWWQNSVLGLAEPLLFALADQQSGASAASALVYELEGFSWRWNQPSVGILDFFVRPELRGQGLGKLLLFQVLRYVQEQCFELAELQVPEGNEPAVRLCQALGFTRVDTGRTYQKQ